MKLASKMNKPSHNDYFLKFNTTFDNLISLLNQQNFYVDGLYIVSLTANAEEILKDGRKRIGDTSLTELEQFKLAMSERIQYRINLIIDDRVKHILEILEKVIEFYNNFLSLLKRYRNEVCNESSEKEWIYQQRQALKQVSEDVKAILEIQVQLNSQL